jgi:glycerol-3-phosphate acyltransferase PlsY
MTKDGRARHARLRSRMLAHLDVERGGSGSCGVSNVLRMSGAPAQWDECS